MPKRPCLEPGCPALVDSGRCARHAAGRAWRGWYRTARWAAMRQGVLMAQPLCPACHAEGRTEPATVVDHIEPHRGNVAMFWDVTNLQALCEAHHNRKTVAGR